MNWNITELIWEDSGSLKRVVKTVVSKFSNTISGSSASQLHLTNVPSASADLFMAWDSLEENTVKILGREYRRKWLGSSNFEL